MSITEEFQKRQAEKPDLWTLAWWREQFLDIQKGYKGATHGINRALADYEDLGKQVREAHQLIHKLYADAELDRAKIGELQVRLERQAEFLNTLKLKEKSNAP